MEVCNEEGVLRILRRKILQFTKIVIKNTLLKKRENIIVIRRKKLPYTIRDIKNANKIVHSEFRAQNWSANNCSYFRRGCKRIVRIFALLFALFLSANKANNDMRRVEFLLIVNSRTEWLRISLSN